MKKRMIGMALLLCLMLGGCGNGESFEVISDNFDELPAPNPAQVQINLPADATLEVMSGNDWKVYQGEHYQIVVQNFSAGNLDQTLQQICGYNKANLNVIELTEGEIDKYLCAWSAVSEEGELVGRCAVLDDGRYHYCLTVMVEAEMSGALRDTVDAIFASYALEVY